jgi:hypothetical protein
MTADPLVVHVNITMFLGHTMSLAVVDMLLVTIIAGSLADEITTLKEFISKIQ